MNLLDRIEALRRKEHLRVEEDCWYGCPADPDYCGSGSLCTCGLEEHNAGVDAILKDVTLFLTVLDFTLRSITDPDKEAVLWAAELIRSTLDKARKE